jgi:MYXO-CTERM domain-containing protein
VTLDYDRDPQQIPEQPFLSYPTMAERYAMYNVFLGFRLATQLAQTDYNCAASVLGATRASALAWNETHGNDPDITADIQLADLFIANLRTAGATGETTLASCPAADNPYPDDGGYGYGNDVAYTGMACSSSGANAGWLLVLGALLVVWRRRR